MSAAALLAMGYSAVAVGLGSSEASGGTPTSGPTAESGALFVNMIGSSNRYSLGRYVSGEPAPAGPVAASRCDLWSPSVVRARGRFWLYADENDCRTWQRIVLFKSRDGVHFRRYGAVIRRPPGEGQPRMPYVVFDHGLFRAWYTVDRGARLGQALVYAESRDGVHFKTFPGARARARGLDRGAMTVEMVVRHPGRRWTLFYTAFDASLERALPAAMRFAEPRQRRYRRLGPIAALRDQWGVVASGASAGDRELRVASAPFAIGDPVVIAGEGSATPDAATVSQLRGQLLTLDTPLRFDHPAGDAVVAADARKISPSYVCRSAGGWLGLFTVFGQVPRAGSEYVLAFRADRLTGPYTLDSGPRFPLLSALNGEFKRSVENPTAVTTSPAAPRCSDDLVPAS